MTLTTAHENMKPGTMKLYFASSDVTAAHKELSAGEAKVNEVKDDLFGPGSGVSLRAPFYNSLRESERPLYENGLRC